MSSLSHFLNLSALGVVASAVTGLCVYYRNFAKVQIGFLFSLELIFLLWLLLSFLGNPSWLVRGFSYLKRTLPFFILSGIHLVFDLFSLPSYDKELLFRILQHAVIFIYPLLWTSLGVWVGLASKEFCSLLILMTFTLNALPMGEPVINLSVGPLATVLFALCIINFSRQISNQSNAKGKWVSFFYVLISSIVCFFPFWNMLNTRMQRTSLLMVVFTLCVFPFFFRGTVIEKWTSWLKLIGLSFVLFSIGVLFFKDTHGSFSQSFYHEEDRLQSHMSAEEVAQKNKMILPDARFRKFLWKNAWDLWKTAPLLGIGFVSEIPDKHPYKGTPNTEFLGGPPIIGPHNSYLNILTRTGVIGLVAFFYMLSRWAFHVSRIRLVQQLSLENLRVLVLTFVPIYGFIYAFLNIGFESPHNSALLWLFFGMGLVYFDKNSLERPPRGQLQEADSHNV